MTKLHKSVKVFKKDQAKLVHRLIIGDQLLVVRKDYFHYSFAYSAACFTTESLRRYREHCAAATAWCRTNLGMDASGKAQTVYRGRKEIGYPVNPQWRAEEHATHHEFYFIDENQAFLFKLMFG